MSDGGNSEEIKLIDVKIASIKDKICILQKNLQNLQVRKQTLQKKIEVQSSEKLASIQWERPDFEWSDQLQSTLYNVFKINSFRPQQLSAMNATLKGHNTLVVMPTGAGKSLCYQLPALINKGRTIVISPLISLMEDQVMNLQKINYPAKIMSSNSSKSEISTILEELVDPKSPLKLLYVTPERFAKSKRFVSKLQKCYDEGLLQRIAIDEVHCCSQWGHDFRPDYKYLSILNTLFTNTPILGLTATATSRVLQDVQDMLSIGGCLIIRSSFNRPNLFYQIIEKPISLSDSLCLLENLLRCRYKNQTGIIYVATIKDCEDITEGLRKKSLKVGSYHANLESDSRSLVHAKWSNKHYQAIVATVAFGMGIDKPDVRFVIHYSLSKAMESYYQESGRAGRDGKRAECIMMYRFQDIFKVSTMVISSPGGKDHLYGMIKYCIEPQKCRRSVIAEYFNESWREKDCRDMCDRCCQKQSKGKAINITKHCHDLYKILDKSHSQDVKLTAQKLLDAWCHKGPMNLRVQEVKCNFASRSFPEHIVAHLLVEGFLKEDFHFNPYTTISYIKRGDNDYLIHDKAFAILMEYKEHKAFDFKELAPESICAEYSTKSNTNTLNQKRKFNEIINLSDDDEQFVNITKRSSGSGSKLKSSISENVQKIKH